MATPESIIKKFTQFKTLPHVAIRLTKMIAANEGSTSDYEEVVKHDPALVMRLFKLVNSAWYGLDKKVSDTGKPYLNRVASTLYSFIIHDFFEPSHLSKLVFSCRSVDTMKAFPLSAKLDRSHLMQGWAALNSRFNSPLFSSVDILHGLQL